MNGRITINRFLHRAIYFSFVFLTLSFVIHQNLTEELADDGAFFLRYAQNMLHGQFWVWNLGESPIWGASAPLYPLLIALVMKLGVPPIIAVEYTGIVVGAVAFALVSVTLARRVGILSAGLVAVFAAFDTWVMYYSGSGLETPLTFLLLAAGVWCLLEDPGEIVVGIVVGLLCVHKLDLIPVGALLLAAQGFRSGIIPKLTLKVAAIIAVVWYGFAWIYFGAPVPNSFLTKSLHQGAQHFSIDWTWFGQFVFLSGLHVWLSVFALFAIVTNHKKYLPLFIFLAGTLIVHLVAYTIKYPFEPYNWYCMPSVFSLLVLAAMGVDKFGEILLRRMPAVLRPVCYAVPIVLVCSLLIFNNSAESKVRDSIRSFTSNQEYDRSQAGKWVDNNTPDSFKVFTMWGNPAYYSKRYVFDGSFLNRKYEDADLVERYRPEVLIMQNNPGSSPGAPVFAFNVDRGYTVVKVFDKTYRAGMDYFFAVLVRDDVLEQVRNIDLPRDLYKYVSDTIIGDEFGVIKPIASNALFIHPGASSATRFKFDLASFLQVSGRKVATVEFKIAENVPAAAVVRGGCNVRVVIYSDGRVIGQDVVTVGHPYSLDVNLGGNPSIVVSVDNNGNPDTDWVILSISDAAVN